MYIDGVLQFHLPSYPSAEAFYLSYCPFLVLYYYYYYYFLFFVSPNVFIPTVCYLIPYFANYQQRFCFCGRIRTAGVAIDKF